MNWIGINPKVFDTSDLSLFLKFFSVLVPVSLSASSCLLLNLARTSVSSHILLFAVFQSPSLWPPLLSLCSTSLCHFIHFPDLSTVFIVVKSQHLSPESQTHISNCINKRSIGYAAVTNIPSLRAFTDQIFLVHDVRPTQVGRRSSTESLRDSRADVLSPLNTVTSCSLWQVSWRVVQWLFVLWPESNTSHFYILSVSKN